MEESDWTLLDAVRARLPGGRRSGPTGDHRWAVRDSATS